MDGVRRDIARRYRHFPYYISIGFVLGCSHDRTCRRKQRSSHWYTEIVCERFTNAEWLENFRMRRETFELICGRLEDELCPSDHQVEEPLDVKKKVAIAIYWLASSAEYRTVGNLFGVGKATVCVCVHQVCEAIMKVLLAEYVQFPEGDALKNVVKGYEERWGFPNCAGSIDGSHIPIIAPKESHGDYLNRKGFYSLILQGVCDHKYMFTNINIGWPGRVHDARVFVNSDIYFLGDNGSLLPKWMKNIGNTQMPLVLLGDAAYPLKPWLLKPYTGKANLTPAQTTFNYRPSRARMTIENAFGRLKGRWRCLQKRLDVNVEFACSVIGCCVVLHNICESVQDLYREDWDADREEDEDQLDEQLDVRDGGEDVIRCAKELRDELALAFCNGAP